MLPADLPSGVIFRLRNIRPEHVNHHLINIISQYPKALEHGAVITVTEGRLRMRDLPLRVSGQTEEYMFMIPLIPTRQKLPASPSEHWRQTH